MLPFPVFLTLLSSFGIPFTGSANALNSIKSLLVQRMTLTNTMFGSQVNWIWLLPFQACSVNIPIGLILFAVVDSLFTYQLPSLQDIHGTSLCWNLVLMYVYVWNLSYPEELCSCHHDFRLFSLLLLTCCIARICVQFMTVLHGCNDIDACHISFVQLWCVLLIISSSLRNFIFFQEFPLPRCTFDTTCMCMVKNLCPVWKMSHNFSINSVPCMCAAMGSINKLRHYF